ncbi:MAG: DUF423 domain-containing protein [Thermodesulfobacteriota bacterium]
MDGRNLIPLGAFGSCTLGAWMTPDLMTIFKSGVGYHQTYHTLVLLIVAMVSARRPNCRLLATTGSLCIGVPCSPGVSSVLTATESQLS